MNATKGATYCAMRLNVFSDRSWAVICKSSGAIALDAHGRLMTRMTEIRANEVAALLSEQPKIEVTKPAEMN